MRESFVIAKREFLERVRSKWFVVMTVLGPVMMIALILVPALIAGRGLQGAKVDIIDKSGKVGTELAQKLHQGIDWNVEVVAPTTKESDLLAKIKTKELNGFLVIPDDILTSKLVVVTYRGDNGSNQVVGMLLQRILNQVVIAARAKDTGLPDDKINRILGDVEVNALHTTGEAEGKSGVGTMILGYIMFFIMYFAITLYGINVMRSVVTEKSSRVTELMVAATKPGSLMAGKILGVGAAGLLQMAIWLGMAGVTLAYKTQILAKLGAHSDGTMLPALSAGDIGVVIGFFVLGYVFYSAMFAAVGAMVGSEQESQQAQMPITLLLVVAAACMTMITNDPRGSTSATLTLMPFWSPMLMPLRFFLGGASGAELAASFGILVVSTVLVAAAAAKIYRVGILMYGKRPGVGELLRWLRY